MRSFRCRHSINISLQELRTSVLGNSSISVAQSVACNLRSNLFSILNIHIMNFLSEQMRINNSNILVSERLLSFKLRLCWALLAGVFTVCWAPLSIFLLGTNPRWLHAFVLQAYRSHLRYKFYDTVATGTFRFTFTF